MAKILLVDDDSAFTKATRVLLSAEKHTVVTADSVAQAKQALKDDNFDIIFVDLSLPDGSGLELVQKGGPKAVIITGHPSMETAINAVKGQVLDYLVKPLDKEQLIKIVQSAGTSTAPSTIDNATPVFGTKMVGKSESMLKMFRNIEEYGPTDVTILISGESGTGKDLVAEAIHNVHEQSRPFIPINCGAIPKELISSELFGHEKGSFTGAAAQRQGVFERAENGTVFLDEIGELPMEQQVALLRVLENRTIVRVGGSKEIQVTARFVAATNKDLAKEVSEGRFREDLYYRLMVLPIDVPALRNRKDDIPLLVSHFLEQYAKEHNSPRVASPEAMKALQDYHWPGNVRELKHAVLRAAILNRKQDSVEVLPDNFCRPPNLKNEPQGLAPGMSIKELEKKLIEQTLDHFGGNKSQASDALGISLKTLYNRLGEYGTHTE